MASGGFAARGMHVLFASSLKNRQRKQLIEKSRDCNTRRKRAARQSHILDDGSVAGTKGRPRPQYDGLMNQVKFVTDEPKPAKRWCASFWTCPATRSASSSLTAAGTRFCSGPAAGFRGSLRPLPPNSTSLPLCMAGAPHLPGLEIYLKCSHSVCAPSPGGKSASGGSL